MGAASKIEWTDHTFNPWVGCQKVGPGCDNCYAEGWAKRSGLVQWGPGVERRITTDATWAKPRKWNAQAEDSGTRARVFCASLADVFDNAVPPFFRKLLWSLIRETPHLDWLLLTKRPGNIADMLPPDWGQDGWPNVWLGCTVVNQAEANRDIPKLLAVPARVRFLSMEPLLGPVDLVGLCDGWKFIDPLRGQWWHDAVEGAVEYGKPKLDWVITGGESGHKARPMHPDWARSMRDQCQAAGVPFFFKQWGEWGHALHMQGVEAVSAATAKAGHWAHPHRYRIHGGPEDGHCFESLPEDHLMLRVGKARAGRLLDGREWNEFPGAA